MHPRYTDSPYLSVGQDPKLSTDTAPSGGPLPRLGELGKVYRDPYNQVWQRVKANTVLTRTAVASDVLYWADATKMLVDSDIADSETGRNQCAGALAVGHTVPTANQLFWILQEKRQATLNGTNVNFVAIGGSVIADATGGLVNYVAPGTASTYQPVGFVHTAVDRSGGAGTVVVDLMVPSIMY